MNELQRLQYLDAMGVDTYMPRWVLPNAPAVVLCEPVAVPHPGEANEVRHGSVSGESAEKKLTTPIAAQVDDVLSIVSDTAPVHGREAALPRETLLDESPQSRERLSDTVLDSTPQAEEDVRFSLSFWRVSEELLVVDSRHSELALPTEVLLGNILLALGYSTSTVPRAEVISWPMFEDFSAPKGESAAREAIAAMLEAMLESHPVKYCLLMGEEAGYFVLPAESLLALSAESALTKSEPLSRSEAFNLCLGKSLPLTSLNATSIVVPSLSSMLQEPGLKALTWKSVQPLRVR